MFNFKDVYTKEPIFTIKKLKTAYGVYRLKTNTITLSTSLAKYADLYIDSVISHELCHIRYFNHQAGFYKLYEEKFPNAKKIQHNLRMLKYRDKF